MRGNLLYGKRPQSRFRPIDYDAARDVSHILKNRKLLESLIDGAAFNQFDEEQTPPGSYAVISLFVDQRYRGTRSFSIAGTSYIDHLEPLMSQHYDPKLHKATFEANAVVDLARKRPLIYLLGYKDNYSYLVKTLPLDSPDLNQVCKEHYQLHQPRS
jgi:hypothetical protein